MNINKIIAGSLLLLSFFASCIDKNDRIPVVFSVDASKTVGPNTGFWKAVGHDYLFKNVNEPCGQELLNRAQRDNSISYYRTHYTFSNSSGRDKEAGGSVCGRVLSIDEKGVYHYDFSVVNRTFREYVKRGMKPIIEFDHFPDGMSAKSRKNKTDESLKSAESGPADWTRWEELLRKFMQNLVDTFGVDEMRTWYFEVWNEPDGWPVNELHVFFRMYDIFADVVKSFDNQFKVGGPASFNMYFMEYFLQHVVNGTNYVTGQKGSPVDFISHHIYGLSGGWLHSPPTIVPQVSRFTIELLWMERMLQRHGLMGKVEFQLNEWGVCSNFERTVDKYPQLVYRNNEFSALFLVKLADCLYALEDNFKFKTSLLAYWGFCGETSLDRMFTGNRDLATGAGVPKPILFAYDMLAKLGKDRLAAEDFYIGSRYARGERFGIIPAKDDNRLTFIVYNFNETDDDLKRTDKISVNLLNLPAGLNYRWTEILLDDRHNNNHTRWINSGSPGHPSELTPEFISESMELKITGNGSAETDKNGTLKMDIPLKRHSMKFIELVPDGRQL